MSRVPLGSKGYQVLDQDPMIMFFCTLSEPLLYPVVLILQDLQASPSWEPTAPKEMKVNLALQVSLALLDSLARSDRQACVTTAEAVREFLSSQVSCRRGSVTQLVPDVPVLLF